MKTVKKTKLLAACTVAEDTKTTEIKIVPSNMTEPLRNVILGSKEIRVASKQRVVPRCFRRRQYDNGR
jgi:hypothetical protein